MYSRFALAAIAIALFNCQTVPSAHAQITEPTPTTGNGDKFRLSPSGYLQLDFLGFPNWTVRPGSGRLNRDEVSVRRVNAGLDGQWRRLSFEVSVDPIDDDGVFVKDAYAEFRLSNSLSLRGGQFKLPGTREYLTSAKNIDFMERTAFTESLGAGRDIGLMLDGGVGKRFDYQAGFFAGDSSGRRERAGSTLAGRAVWEPVDGLEVGGSISDGRVDAVADNEPENGFDGRAPSGYRFFDRLYVKGRRLRTGGDVEWTLGAWRITAAGIRVRDERRDQGIDYDDLPSIIGKAWSVSARWRFAQRRDLALRYERIRLNDEGPETMRDSIRPRASDVRARGAQTLTLGLSWKPAPWLRLLGTTGIERYFDRRSAPEAGRPGNYFVLGGRLQFEIP